MAKETLRPEEKAWRILVGFNLSITSDILEDQFLERYFDFEWLPEDLAIKNLTGLSIFDNEAQISLKLEKRFKAIRKIARQYELAEEEMMAILCKFENGYLKNLVEKAKKANKEEAVKEQILGKLQRTIDNIEKSNISSFLGSVELSRTFQEVYDTAIAKIDKKLSEPK